MPIGNPNIIFNLSLKGLTKNPAFAQLSPDAQAAMLAQVKRDPMSPLNLAQNPALTAAIQEAQQKGLMNNDPLWKDILKGTAIAGGVAAAGPAIGALTGGAPAATAGTGSVATGTSAADAAAGGVLPSTGSIGVSALPAGGAGLAAGAGGAVVPDVVKNVAGTGFGAALKAALPTIIGAGASVGGAAIASHGNTEAAKIQAEQADRALAQAKQIYQQQRSDLSPYREEGFQALGPLNFGLGLPAPTRTTGPFDQTATTPVVALGAKDAQGQPMPGAGQNQVIPPPPTYAQEHAGTLSQIGQGGLVSMQNPQTGLVHLIPSDQVTAAQQAGGVRV